MSSNIKFSPFLFFISLVFFACQEDDLKKDQLTLTEHRPINEWILDEMSVYYLWAEELPTNADLNQRPEDYFQSLLHPEDRFSWIQDNYQELLNSLKGINKEAGYEFVLYRDSEDADLVIAQVVYVKPNSPAASNGIQRGDIITHINDERITISNYRDLLDEMSENHTINYQSIDAATESMTEEKTATLNTVEYAENPSYFSSVINRDSRKIGYYVYNFFASGPDAQSSQYDEEMDQIFSDFKAAGVTDLVLDLRFNSGGSELSANNLASLLAPNITANSVFAKKRYNDQLQDAISNDPNLGPDYLTSKFQVKPQNIGSQLSGGKVYVLTSQRSASASELVINSLKPFMDVVIIGDTTYGKNVGSISIYDENDPDNTYGMQPIVVQVYNSLDQSDYGNGFTPNIIHPDNRLFIFPLGDEREVLLARALANITGDDANGRAASVTGKRMIDVGHSLDFKKRSFQLVTEPPVKR